jgi:L-alanine-DL-glutamate epimerase-like enolase superfamily enzyme
VGLNDGTIGWAEAIPRPMIYGETLASVLHVLESILAPAAIGLSVADSETYRARTRHLVNNPTAHSSVELAMFDALCRSLGIAAHRLLGGHSSAVACSTILSWGQPAEVVEQAAEARNTWGIGAFKLKVGLDLDIDVATVAAVRDALGRDVILYADANRGYTPSEAGRFLERTEEFQLAWFEEPTTATWAARLHMGGRGVRVPIVGDESCADPASATAAMLEGRVGMVSLKTARTAIRRSTLIRDVCEALGAEVTLGSQGESMVGACAAASFAASHPMTAQHPAEVVYFLDLESDIALQPLEVIDGRVALSESPGFGFELDADALRSVAVRAPLLVRA